MIANILSHSMGCLFTSLVASYDEQKLILIFSNLSASSLCFIRFCSFGFCPCLRYLYLLQGHKDVVLCFLLKASLFFYFIFRPWCGHWLLCRCELGQGSFFPCGYQVHPETFTEKIILYPLYGRVTFLTRWPYINRSISEPYIQSH